MQDAKFNHIINSVKKVCGTSSSLPLHEPEISNKEKYYVEDCLNSGWISSVGKYVDEFEHAIKTYTGSKYAIATVNGTSALHICMILAEIGKDEEVLVPNLTFIATANAVCYASAIPHLIDVSEHTLGVDPEKLDDYLQACSFKKRDGIYNKITGRKISALVVMHTFGHAADMEKILSTCLKYNLKIIEDAAESLGSNYQNQHTGTFAELAALSFNGNKIISCGGGGAILTNNDKLAQKARHLTTTAKIPNTISSEHDQIGYNYRLPNINAALGLAQLESMEDKLLRKRILAQKYIQEFKENKLAYVYEEKKPCSSNYWLNLLILKQPSLEIRDNLIKEFISNQIFVRPVWGLMHRQRMFLNSPQMQDLSNSKKLSESIICLPSSPQLVQV